MSEKPAGGVGSPAALKAEHQQRGHDQADEPGAAGLGFPQRRLRVALSAFYGLKGSMYAACGEPGSLCQAPNALCAVFTNRLDNDNTFGPQSHGVGPCSEGWLKSWLKSA